MDLKSKTGKLKELAKNEIRQAEDYFNLMIDLERILEDCRLNISTAKTQNGFTLSTVGLIDKREMEPSTLVEVTPDEEGSNKFELVESHVEEKEDSNLRQRKAEDEEEKPKKSSKPPPNFRPFGLLEPRAAKIARQTSMKALEKICELSSIQSTIFSIENQIKSLDKDIIDTLGNDYDNFVKISSESLDSNFLQEETKTNIWIKSIN